VASRWAGLGWAGLGWAGLGLAATNASPIQPAAKDSSREAVSGWSQREGGCVADLGTVRELMLRASFCSDTRFNLLDVFGERKAFEERLA